MLGRFLVIACLLVSSRAHANPTLAWEAPASCPSAQAATEAIERMLGRSLSGIHADAQVTIVQHAEGEMHARIVIRAAGQRSERVLRDDNCQSLAAAAVVVVALAIDQAAQPDAGSRRKPKRASKETPAPPDAAPPVEATKESAAPIPPVANTRAPRPASPRRTPLPITWYVAGGAALSAGPLPGLSPSVQLSGGVALGRWRTGLRVAHAPAQTATLDVPSQPGVRIALASASIEAGPRLMVVPIECSVLLGFEAGSMRAEGADVLSSRSTSSLWLAPYLGLHGSIPLFDPLAVGLGIDGLFALRTPPFVLFDDGGVSHTVHQPGRFGGRVYLTAELRF